MELQTLVQYKNKKRRERAARMAEEAMEDPVGILDDLDSAEEDTDLLKLKPPRPPRPKKVKELLTEPLYEEDIIEGFSFCSFKTYEDLDKMAKWSSQHNGKFPDPYSKLKLDEEKLKKKKKKKKDKNRDRDSILSQIDPNTNKGSSGSSSEKGYICDSDSDGDKGSDTGVGDLFRARTLSNVCQNGLSPAGGGGGVVTVKSEAGLLQPQLQRAGAPFVNVPASVPVSSAAAPPPKPLYRPFAISPPPSTAVAPLSTVKSSTVAPLPSSTLAAASSVQPHPAYRPFDNHNPFFPSSSALSTPHYPAGHHHHGHHPHHLNVASSGIYNGLYPPPRPTVASAANTNIVASSHHDLTCKSHLPKLAHALTTTSPRNAPAVTPHTTPKGYPSLPLNDPANLRRELDNRYLHDRNLAGALRPPHYMGAAAELSSPLSHHLTPPLGRPPSRQPSPSVLASSLNKDFPKMGGPNSLFAGLGGNPPGFPGISPLGSTAVDPLRRTPTSSLSSPSSLIVPPTSSAATNPPTAPKKTGKWNAMHVRIAWEIYNHQQKQKGDKKADNPLVPSTSSSLSKAPPIASPASTASSNKQNADVQITGQKRPAPGPMPSASDFLHKRPTTDADILRNQLFAAPPRPPTLNPMDPLANPLLQRPPYMPPFGHAAALGSKSAMSPFGPRFGTSNTPFGGLGSLRDSALAAAATGAVTPGAHPPPPNPLSYPGLTSLPSVSAAAAVTSSLYGGLPRPPGFPFAAPNSSSWLGKTEKPKPPVIPPPPTTPKLKPALESPKNSSAKNGDPRRTPTSHSPFLDLKKEDHEVTVVGEKVNNHVVPNGRSSVDSRPPSSHSSTPNQYKTSGHHTPKMMPPHQQLDHKHLAASLSRPPITSASIFGAAGLPGLYPPHPSAAHAAGVAAAAAAHNPFGLDPFRDPYRAALNPYLQSRESLLRLNQLMMTEQERIRMGLTHFPPPPATPILPPHPSPAATPSSLLAAAAAGAKPPSLPAPPLGYPPGYPPGFGATSLPGLAPPPLPSVTPALNGHGHPSGSSSTYHAK